MTLKRNPTEGFQKSDTGHIFFPPRGKEKGNLFAGFIVGLPLQHQPMVSNGPFPRRRAAMLLGNHGSRILVVLNIDGHGVKTKKCKLNSV